MAGSVVPPSDRRRAPAPGPQGTVPRMADLRHVWVRTEDLQIIRADQIVSLAIIGHHGRAESAEVPMGEACSASAPTSQVARKAIPSRESA